MSQDPLNAVLSPACDVMRSLWRSNEGWKRKNRGSKQEWLGQPEHKSDEQISTLPLLPPLLGWTDFLMVLATGFGEASCPLDMSWPSRIEETKSIKPDN